MSRASVALRYFLRVLSLAVFWCTALVGFYWGSPKVLVQSSSGHCWQCFSENEDSWKQNVNMKPSQESYTLWKKASLWQSGEMKRGLILF